MKAIVCDKCGKVTLLEDDIYPYGKDNGLYYLVSDTNSTKLDLCAECAEELLTLVRKEKV